MSDVQFDGTWFTFRFNGTALPAGVEARVPAGSLDDLRGATAEQLADTRLLMGGSAVLWPALDVDMSAVALIGLLFGIRVPEETGRQGGSSRSEAKAAAVRANGAKGGRPRKKVE